MNVLTWDAAYICFAWKLNNLHPDFHIPLAELLPSVPVLLGQATFMTIFYGITKLQEVNKPSDDKEK